MNKQIERIRSKKNRKEPDIGQGCNELLAGTTDAMTSLLLPTISGESRNHYICPVIFLFVDDQPQNEEYQRHSLPVRTTIEAPLPTEQGINVVLE